MVRDHLTPYLEEAIKESCSWNSKRYFLRENRINTAALNIKDNTLVILVIYTFNDYYI